MFKTYAKINKCCYCDNNAEYLFVRNNIFSLSWRFLCESCKYCHNRVRDDLNSNI